MTNNYPEPQEQNSPQRKLILPGQPNEQYSPGASGDQTYIPYEQVTRQQVPPPPTNPLAKFGNAVRTDPAYKVLTVAIVVVLISSMVFLALASNIFAQFSSHPAQTSTQSLPSSPTDQQPTFSTPTGGQGSTTSSLPPTPTPTLVPTAQPTSPPLEALTLIITSIPQQVINNTTVSVLVTSNKPGVTVRLSVTYTVSPNHYISKAQTTGANGMARLAWRIQVSASLTNPTLAQVTAIAQDQNGQQVSSQTITVLIITTKFGA